MVDYYMIASNLETENPTRLPREMMCCGEKMQNHHCRKEEIESTIANFSKSPSG